MDIQQERFACQELKNKGLKRREIAETLGISVRQVKRRLANVDSEDGAVDSGFRPNEFKKAFGVPPMVEVNTVEPSFSVEKNKSLFGSDSVDERRSKVKNLIETEYHGKEIKVLYMADLHIPFADYGRVNKIIAGNKDANLVIINGDLLDLFAVSKYAKDKEVALRWEMDEGREFLEYLSKTFPHIVVTEGNHERRLKSMIANVIPPEMQFLFPNDILKMIVSGEVLEKNSLDNVHVVGSWWINLWDTVYAHPDNYSSAPMRTVINTSEHFLLVKNVPHRVCVIGHTHQAGDIVMGGIKRMETGCLCHPMDYHNGSKFTKYAWTPAFMTQIIDANGQSDFNKSKVIYL